MGKWKADFKCVTSGGIDKVDLDGSELIIPPGKSLLVTSVELNIGMFPAGISIRGTGDSQVSVYSSAPTKIGLCTLTGDITAYVECGRPSQKVNGMIKGVIVDRTKVVIGSTVVPQKTPSVPRAPRGHGSGVSTAAPTQAPKKGKKKGQKKGQRKGRK